MSMSVLDCAQTRDGFPRPAPDIPTNVLDQFNMTGKVVLVTGAADGIGLAVATAMAEANASVAMWYNTNESAVAQAAMLREVHGVRAVAYKVDVSSAEQIQQAISDVVAEFGKIDVFVANAGMKITKSILELTLDEYRRGMSVNVDGVVLCAKFIGEVFQRQGSGNLIITSSVSAHIVNVPLDQPVYNATKAFVTHFGKSLAREWREFARVNIVSPGYFETKMGAGKRNVDEACRMTTLGRQGQVREIKGAYLFLASNASTYMTGSDIIIDGGYMLP